jgi:hypothetical protein
MKLDKTRASADCAAGAIWVFPFASVFSNYRHDNLLDRHIGLRPRRDCGHHDRPILQHLPAAPA